MVGGGPGSFIGKVYRMAANLDGMMELTAGAFSSDSRKSKKMGRQLNIDNERVYGSFQKMAQREVLLPDDYFSDTAKYNNRIPAGHPEGFIEAFANIYSNVAEVIAARRSGDEPNTLALDFPTVEDGARGVHFIQKTIESGSNNEWAAMDFEPPASNVKNP